MKYLSGLMLLFCAGPALAQCVARSYSYAPTYAPTYSTYTPTATLVVPVATYVSVPFYAAVYVPPATVTTTTVAPAPTATAQQMPQNDMTLVMKEMLSELREMRKESRESFRAMMPQQQRQAASNQARATNDEQAIADAAVAVLKKPLGMSGVSCATCHSVGVPSEKSADFFLFDTAGQLRNIGEALAQSMTRKISKERKCPGAPAALTGDDKATVLKALPPLDAKP